MVREEVWIMRFFVRAVVLAAASVGSWGCGEGLMPDPPFVYEELSIVYGASEGCHEGLGLHVTIRNTSAQSIQTFRHSFHLFDSEGMPLGTRGAARIEADLTAALPSGTIGTFCTSLDTAFHFVPQGDLQVGQYRIDQVRLADGAVWRPLLNDVTYPYRATLVRDAGDAS
jgi:hypothetical protein